MLLILCWGLVLSMIHAHLHAQIGNETEMENAVSQRLWQLAKEKQQVSHPSAAEGMLRAPNVSIPLDSAHT